MGEGPPRAGRAAWRSRRWQGDLDGGKGVAGEGEGGGGSRRSESLGNPLPRKDPNSVTNSLVSISPLSAATTEYFRIKLRRQWRK